METNVIIQSLIDTAINAVKPENFIPATVQLNGSDMIIQGKTYDLNQYKHIYIAAVGKAAIGMTAALDQLIHPFVTEGVILAKHIPEGTTIGQPYRLMTGSHPVPSQDSVNGAREIINLVQKAEENDLVIFLISGGGSALMTMPQGDISLEVYQKFSSQILACGADITEFNTLRKHLDSVKGGHLAQAAAPAEQITLILSDVVGSPLDIIASGPTVPDPSTFSDALNILDKYSNDVDFPTIIRETLKAGEAGKIIETLKSDDPAFSKEAVFLAAENPTAAHAAARKGTEMGLDARVLNTRLTGEASSIGALLPSFFSEMSSRSLAVFGGETTVHIKGNGMGGRNMELALAAVRPMAQWPGCALVALATDGEDGPTDAAGAIVTSETLQIALEKGCVPEDYLANNDAYHFFETVGGLLKIGSSGTNVNDLTFLIRNIED